MSELSPATQAVLDAYSGSPLIKDHLIYRYCLAAALRVAADQVVPANVDYFKSLNVRRNLLAIADELENQ